MGNITQEPFYAPSSSAGEAPFVTDVFSMLPYCWCGGDAHPDGCPPNFTWRNVQISWYKHLGRGTSSNIDLSPDLISELLDDCLASVREMDVS